MKWWDDGLWQLLGERWLEEGGVGISGRDLAMAGYVVVNGRRGCSVVQRHVGVLKMAHELATQSR